MSSLDPTSASVVPVVDTWLLRLRRRLDRIEAALGLAALALVGSALLVIGLLALVILIHLVLYRDFGWQMIGVIAVILVIVPLIIVEYRTIKVYDDVYRLAVYPTSLAVGLWQTQGGGGFRIIRGAWWLIHVVLLFAGAGMLVAADSIAPLFDQGLEIVITEIVVKFCLAAGTVYACNTLILCTVACWSASERVVLGVWRVRLLLTTAIGLTIGLVRFSTVAG
jgi:hypothetical protein